MRSLAVALSSLALMGLWACGSDEGSTADSAMTGGAGNGGSSSDASSGGTGATGGSATGGGGGSDGGDAEGLRMCCELGAVCHAVDDLDGPLAECHDVGHQNIPSQCRAEYERCLSACEDALEQGAGGAVEHACG